MKVNDYHRRWCNEDYKIDKESFLIENAKYIISRTWALGSLKHGLLVIIPACILAGFNSTHSLLFDFLKILGVLTFSFFMYGCITYNDNDISAGRLFYIVLAFLGYITMDKLKPWEITTFTLLTMLLYIFLTFVLPIFHKIKYKGFKKRNIDMETEKERRQEESYQRWKKDYENYRYGLPDPNSKDENPLISMVREWFSGYDTDLKALKTRYRTLAKQHHPDESGEEETFKAIRYVYEELQDTLNNL